MSDERAVGVGAALREIPLSEIGVRISRHLRRLEAKQEQERGGRKDEVGRRRFYVASAGQVGRYVSVSYITYQGSTNLTKAEAVHYLHALDNGFNGTHSALFRSDPPLKPDGPVVRFTSLVRTRHGFALYGVHKRTKTRVYGERVGGEYVGAFVERRAVLKWQATEDDLRRVCQWEKERDDAIQAARVAFARKVKSLTPPDSAVPNPEDSDE
jgi:hypothetical protein